jgi:hypothetical protein
MKDLIAKGEVGEKLPEILYVCGFDFIPPSEVANYDVRGHDIVLSMQDGKTIKLRGILKAYEETLGAYRETLWRFDALKQHHSFELYLKLCTPYDEYEKIVSSLDVSKIKKLNEKAGKIKGRKILVPVMKGDKVVDAVIERITSYEIEKDPTFGHSAVQNKILLSRDFVTPVDLKELLEEEEE